MSEMCINSGSALDGFFGPPHLHIYFLLLVYILWHTRIPDMSRNSSFSLCLIEKSFQLSWKHRLIANLFWKSESKAYRKAFKTIALLIIRQLHLTWHIHWENYTLSVPAGTTLLSFVFAFYKNPMLFHRLTLCIGKMETKHLWEIKINEPTVKFYKDKKCD